MPENISCSAFLTAVSSPDLGDWMAAKCNRFQTLEEANRYLNQYKLNAEQSLREALLASLQPFGDSHPDSLASKGNLARYLAQPGFYTDAAAALQGEILDISKKIFRPPNPCTSTVGRDVLSIWDIRYSHLSSLN